MRVINNYGSSLLDYLNNDVSLQQVLDKGATGSKLSAAAKKTLEDNGISIGGSGTHIKTNTDTSVYTSIKNTTENLRKSVILLTDKEDDSILAKAEESGDTTDAVKLTEDFTKEYNEMLIAMKDMGGTTNTNYAKELTALVDSNKEALEKIGITKGKDGTLKIDSDVLKAAKASDIKEAFAGKSDFAESIAQKSIYIEANAISAMYSSSVSNYTNNGLYNDSAMSSFLKSI